MRIDAVAALRMWAVQVDLGGQSYRIAPRPAVEWMTAVLEGQWLDIVPGWLEVDADYIDDGLQDGTITYVECVAAARDALAQMAGTMWWAAARLICSAARDPDTAGELWLAGVDPGRVPLGAVIAATYRLYTREASAADRARLDMDLERTPPGVSAEERYDPAAAAAGFAALAAARGMQ